MLISFRLLHEITKEQTSKEKEKTFRNILLQL